MAVSIAPVKVEPAINVESLVARYREIYDEVNDAHQAEYGGYWPHGGGKFQPGSVDPDGVNDQAWDEWFAELTSKIDDHEEETGVFDAEDGNDPRIPGYCQEMYVRLIELADAIAPHVGRIKRGDVVGLANPYSITLKPIAE